MLHSPLRLIARFRHCAIDLGFLLPRKLDAFWIINHEGSGIEAGATNRLAVGTMANCSEIDLANDLPLYRTTGAAALDRHLDEVRNIVRWPQVTRTKG
jgi:hypothetical protein